jgi:CBS domain-containing protein
VAGRLVYVSRLVRLPLFGPDGTEIGRMADVVLGAARGERPPLVNGFVVTLQRRKVFVAAGRIGEVTSGGARLRRGAVDLGRFELRPGEGLVAGSLFGRTFRGRRVVDVAIRPVSDVPFAWEVATVALGAGRLARRQAREVLDWSEASTLFTEERPEIRQAATLAALHPAEMAVAVRRLPAERRRALARGLGDERLADLLEELPEDEQVRLVEDLDLQRLGHVLDEMEADDAADLLGAFSPPRRNELLGAMMPDEATAVRRLLSYDPATAGGLMTPDPLVVGPSATVAEALARVRDPDRSPVIAAQVFVTEPPTATPTGRYLGMATYQRLLREPPFRPVVRCLEDYPAPLPVEAGDREVASRVAAYDAVALPVSDAEGRLVGAVTIDDVLDHVLPKDWRKTRR